MQAVPDGVVRTYKCTMYLILRCCVLRRAGYCSEVFVLACSLRYLWAFLSFSGGHMAGLDPFLRMFPNSLSDGVSVSCGVFALGSLVWGSFSG